MRKSLIPGLFFLFLSEIIIAQVNLNSVKKESWQVFAYKINAADAEKYILKDSIDIDRFLSYSPVAIFPSDSVDEKKLPTGQYVSIAIDLAKDLPRLAEHMQTCGQAGLPGIALIAEGRG